MRIIFILLTVLFYQSKSQKTEKYFSVTGRADNKLLKYVFISYTNCKKIYVIDSIILKDGKFNFSGCINEPTLISLQGKRDVSSVDDSDYTDFFIEPNAMKIDLNTTNYKKSTITGSKTQNERNKLLSLQSGINSEMINLDLLLRSNRDSIKKYGYNSILSKKDDSILALFSPYKTAILKLELEYVYNNLNSFLSSYLLSNNYNKVSIDSLKMFFNRFTSDVKSGSWGRKVSLYLSAQPGERSKNFKSITSDGESIELSTLSGESYVLLDFWATWCIPCRQETPHLLSIYHKYKNSGLKIVSIANDDLRVDAWKRSIEDEKMNEFKNILQGVGNNNIGMMYAIGPIPTKILIDKDGYIIFRHTGNENVLLDNKLIEIFGF